MMLVIPTRLHIPAVRADAIARPALLRRLDTAWHYPLTIVIAPAGYGKTTLLAAWLTNAEPGAQHAPESSRRHDTSALPAAWLALDAIDNDPVRLLAGLIAALQTIDPAIGAAARTPVQTLSPPDYRSALTILIGDLLTYARPIVLVLDDTHLLNDAQATSLLADLVERQPPNLHLVLAGRADPLLPLARLRARGGLNELRAADLRFSLTESGAFLRTTMRLTLAEDQVAHFARRTEGWPVGLQLAALALQQARDPEAETIALVEQHRFVLDYLADEVLSQQAPEIQHFLLGTAILERMCGSLCAVVLDNDDEPQTTAGCHTVRSTRHAAMLLEVIERANLFLIPLDTERCWYRYHHLFADLLRYRLQQRAPERIPGLHRRAAHWFARQEFPDEAIHHALAAGETALAADLIGSNGRSRLARGELATLQHWLAALPPEHLAGRPDLLLLQAWIHVWEYQPDIVERLLTQIERTGAPHTPQLSAEVLALHAFLARSRDDQAAALRLARQSLTHAGEDPWLQGFIQAGMGDMAWFAEDVTQALECHRCALAYACRCGDLVQLVDAAYTLSQFELLQGRLRAAEAAYTYGDQALAAHDAAARPFRHLLSLSRAGILYERYELLAARTAAETGLAWTTRCGLSIYEPFAQIELARISAAQGDTAAAHLALLALQQGMQRLIPHSDQQRPVWFDTLRLRQVEVWASLGDMPALAQRVVENWTPPDPAAPVGLMIRQLALALALVACLKHQDRLAPLVAHTGNRVETLASQLLTSCRQRFRAWGLGAVVLERETLTAVLHQHTNAPDQAQAALHRALTLAAPETFVRPFLSRGAPMQQLCVAALHRRNGRHDPHAAFLRHLLALFDASAAHHPVSVSLPEPLTPRELEVLPLLAAGCSHRQIAIRLTITPHTARTHIKNIYGKLQVQNRVQAVERARTLNLIPSNTTYG